MKRRSIMGVRATFSGLLLICVVVCWGAVVSAEPVPNPVLKFKSQADVELDLGIMVEDLLPSLLEAMAQGEEGDEEMARFYIDLLGIKALDRLHMESQAEEKYASSVVTLTLDNDQDGGLLAEFFAIPQGKSGFAEYVNRDDVVLYSTVHNLKGHLKLLLDLPRRPEFADMAGDMPLDGNGDLALPGFVPRTDLLPLLSGELDIVMLEGPDSPEGAMFDPMSMPVFVVLGTEDGPALLEMILTLADTFGGESAAGMTDMIRSMTPEAVGDFELTALPMGGAIAVSKDYFVLGLAVDAMRTMLADAQGDLKVPAGRTWTYIDGKKYGEAMQGIMDMAAMFEGDGADQIERELMQKMYGPFFDHLESETIYTTSKPGELTVEAEVDGAVGQGLYAMLYTFMAELPELVAAEATKSKARSVVPMLDSALTQYGIDHDGTFPADPMELVGTYLDEFPLEIAVPAGTYMEGGYTYLPLTDQEGRIAGYFLFIYGGGEGTGHDVFTDENVLDPANFVIGSDGYPDGVGGFCYDGLAFEQFEAWSGY
jgi:hypothetical protein